MNVQKIAAFTMMDILTGMVVTSIIVGMVFYVFSSLNQQVANYGNTRNEINAYLLMRNDLIRQFDNPETIIYGVPNGIEVVQGEQEITYTQNNSLLIREINRVVDTVCNSIEALHVNFVKDEDGEPTVLVKGLVLDMGIGGQEITCRFNRHYSQVDNMNQKLVYEF